MQKTSMTLTEKVSDNDLAALAFFQSPIATLILDEKATILNVNLAFMEMSGYDESDLLGKHISFFESDQNDTSLYDSHYRDRRRPTLSKCMEVYIQCKNDAHLLVCNKGKTIISDGSQYTILIFEDITEGKRILEHYQHLAMHDSLTGLANRVLLEDNFKKAQNRALRNHQKMAILLCDINEFKQCNDRNGHDFGDNVLKVVAKTLENLLRINDTLARYGGDEFVLIIEDIAHRDEVDHIVTKIKAAFPLTFVQDEYACHISISIGSAYFPDEGSNFNGIMQIADQNMYQDKKDFYASH